MPVDCIGITFFKQFSVHNFFFYQQIFMTVFISHSNAFKVYPHIHMTYNYEFDF